MSDEPAGIDPYDAVLADLHAKRDQIDQAIAAIESLRSGAPATPRPAPGAGHHGQANQGVDGPGAKVLF